MSFLVGWLYHVFFLICVWVSTVAWFGYSVVYWVECSVQRMCFNYIKYECLFHYTFITTMFIIIIVISMFLFLVL